MSKRLFVGSLAYSTTAATLEALFGEVGKVENLSLITDKFSGQSKGFAFVEMDNKDADEAIAKLNGKEVDGRKIVVNEARPREERPRDDRRGGGNFGNRGGKRW